MKTAILYASVHHGNTKLVVDAIAEVLNADLYDLTKCDIPDISDYDLIGFASGAYFQKMHARIQEAASLPGYADGKKVFLVCTCGLSYKSYTGEIKAALRAGGADIVGNFQCLGYDTFGPFKLVGGIAKGHPDAKDLENAKAFAQKLMK